MTQQLGPNQAKWLQALRSGSYPQTSNHLHDTSGFCCLGVACELFKTDETRVDQSPMQYISYDGQDAFAPKFVETSLALRSENGDPVESLELELNEVNMCMTSLNDEGCLTFSQIADTVEFFVTDYFKEPV